MAYTGFRANIEFRFYPELSFIPPNERDVMVEGGGVGNLETEPTVVKRMEIPLAPPNQVREDAGMPTPVLVTDNEGKSVEKWVTRGARPSQFKTPKNKMSGGGQ